MSTFSESDLVRYSLGDAPAELAGSIEQAIRSDPRGEVAGQVALLCGMLGPSAESARPSSPARRRQIRRWLVAAVFVALAGVAWGAYVAMSEQPLLEDNFNDNFIDPRLWRAGRRGIREANGHMRLMNRGSLVTVKEFDGPIEVSFDWRWLDHAEDPLYAENLNVALHTTGKHDAKHPYEIRDGVVVQFHGMGGTVKAFSPQDPKLREETEKPDMLTPFPAEVWHRVRITDDGEFISVYVSGPQIDEKYKKKTPVLRFRCVRKFEGKHVAVYNRELVGEAIHESHLDKFKIVKLAEK